MTTDLNRARQHREVLLANRRFYQAFEHLDITEMSGIWAQEEWVQCVHPGWPILSGWRAVRDSWVRIFNNTRSMTIEAVDPKVSVQGSMAWVVCIEQLTTLVDEAPQHSRVVATNLFIRPPESAAWLMVHHHGSPVFLLTGEQDASAEETV
jgi:ketosteroid isomerase-like protein